jgi:putative transposase
MHNQACLYLCKTFDRILIPTFETQNMVRNNRKRDNKFEEKLSPEKKKELKDRSRRSRLNKRVKFVLNMESHYKFRQQLLNKGQEYGCEIVEVTEEYTSQCCGNCGHLSKNYVGREKVCSKCKFRINRDINGARNILLKNMDLVLEPISDEANKNNEPEKKKSSTKKPFNKKVKVENRK